MCVLLTICKTTLQMVGFELSRLLTRVKNVKYHLFLPSTE